MKNDDFRKLIRKAANRKNEADISNENSPSVLDEIRTLRAQADVPIESNVHIEVVGHERAVSKKGNSYDNMIYKVRPVGTPRPLAESRKTPVFTDEAKLILEKVDNEPSSVYQTISEKDDNGYYRYTKIEKVSGQNPTDFFQS